MEIKFTPSQFESIKYQCDQPNIHDIFEKSEVTVKVTESEHHPHTRTFRTVDDTKSYFLYEKCC